MTTPPLVTFVDQSGQLGGAEMMLLDAARAWRDRCRVLLLEDGPFRASLIDAGVDVRVIELGRGATEVRKAAGPTAAFRSVPALVRGVRQVVEALEPCGVVYANTLKAAVVAGLAARRRRVPMVMHLHDLPTAGHFTAMNRRVIRFAATHLADAVVANSHAAAVALRSIGARPRRMTVAYNGFDATAWHHDEDVARVPAVPGGRFCVGVFGRLTPWKGQDVAIRALAQTDDAHALIVGDALFTEEDRAYAASLRTLADELGVAPRVHFLGHRHDIAALMRRCDAVVHCSTAPEPFGRVVVEGQLAERPVVAAAAGGVLEIIDDPRTGRLVPPGDADALAAVLRELQDHPDEAHLMAHAGRIAATSRFSIDAMLAGMDRVVRDLLPPGGSRPSGERPPTLTHASARD
ncbi:MAG: glycosyltransferase family 4 protein [Planctomycetota bacterium]